MKIIQPGKATRKINIYEGKCQSCGCILEANDDGYEIEWEEDRGLDYPTVKCPTSGCGHKIWLNKEPKGQITK